MHRIHTPPAARSAAPTAGKCAQRHLCASLRARRLCVESSSRPSLTARRHTEALLYYLHSDGHRSSSSPFSASARSSGSSPSDTVLAGGSSQGPPTPAQQTAEDIKSKDTFIRVCVKCHPAERVTAEGRSRSQWETTMITMQTARGAVITPEEFDTVLDYLTRYHGRESVVVGAGGPGGPAGRAGADHAPTSAPPTVIASTAAADRGRKIYAAECVTCHGPSARGTERGANLVRSAVVLRDRYGNSIGPFLKKGHPMQTGASSAQPDRRADHRSLALHLAAHQRHAARIAGVRARDVLVGDAKAGRGLLQRRGALRHLPLGDRRSRRLRQAVPPSRFSSASCSRPPRGAAAGPGASRKQVTVTVTLPDGTPRLRTAREHRRFPRRAARRRRRVPLMDAHARDEDRQERSASPRTSSCSIA